MTPNIQQQACIDAVQSSDFLKIDAVAGSGKTSTLVMISEVVKTPSLYCAFNKVTALEAEAKFGKHVVCQTTHSLAYAKFGARLRNKLIRPQGAYINVAYTGGEIGRYFKMFSGPLTKPQLGLFVKKTVERYEQSSDLTIDRKHVVTHDITDAVTKAMSAAKLSNMTKPLIASTINLVLNTAKALWAARINPASVVMASHDTYLKLFQLSKPKLGFDVVYLDEAADTTPCVLDIVMSQCETSKVILVGDDRQSIYQWRGAVNAMTTIGGLTLPLSQSFRYGPAIAEVAMAVLAGTTKVVGHANIASVAGVNVIDITKPYTRLFRTNAALLTEAVYALTKNEKISIEIDTKDFIKLLSSAMALFADNMLAVKHERIIPFANWTDLVEEGKYDNELARVAKLVKENKAQTIIKVLSNYRPIANPHVIMTTAHKSKGREWYQVKLENDFPSHFKMRDNNLVWEGIPVAEQNLLYVAATRASHFLEINRSIKEALDYANGITIVEPLCI